MLQENFLSDLMKTFHFFLKIINPAWCLANIVNFLSITIYKYFKISSQFRIFLLECMIEEPIVKSFVTQLVDTYYVSKISNFQISTSTMTIKL